MIFQIFFCKPIGLWFVVAAVIFISRVPHVLAECIIHKTNDQAMRMLLVMRPREMLMHHWAPVQLWLRGRFHVTSEVLTPRIYTVAAKIVDGLVRDIDRQLCEGCQTHGRHEGCSSDQSDDVR